MASKKKKARAARRATQTQQKLGRKFGDKTGQVPSPPKGRKLSPLTSEDILLATGNAGKLREFKELGRRHNLIVKGIFELTRSGEAPFPEVKETANTFLGNALLKARAAHQHGHISAVADDSGLIVDALKGAPGVRSARFAGEQASDIDNYTLLLEKLQGKPRAERSAAFYCSLVLYGPLAEGEGCGRDEDGVAWRAFEGSVRGVITERPRGEGGFGYDPVFYCPEVGDTFGASTMAQKQAISHRARAFKSLMAYLTAKRDAMTKSGSPLFLRTVGLESVALALASSLGHKLRHANRGLERALAEHPQLGPKERAAVAELLFSALRNLSRLQLAIRALRGETGEIDALDPRELRPSDAGLLAALVAADLDPKGHPMSHKGGQRGSALDGLAGRDRGLDRGLPVERMRLAKALRAATGKLKNDQSLAGQAQLAGVHPDFLRACHAQLGETHTTAALAYLRGRGPLTLRVHPGRGSRDRTVEELREAGVRSVSSPLAPEAVVCLRNTRVTAMRGYAEGLFEIQDAGSQAVAAALEAKPGERIADWCAGAGGKTLGLAAQMRGRGELIALDIHAGRLAECRRRIKRAGERHVKVQRLERDPALDTELGSFDAVLVDAPCSSSGALRRTPELRWHLDSAWLSRFPDQQLDILRRAAARVRPGGRLVYATCSILPAENEDVVARFIAEQPEWRLTRDERIGPADGAWLSQHPLGSIGPDGFYVAKLVRSVGQ